MPTDTRSRSDLMKGLDVAKAHLHLLADRLWKFKGPDRFDFIYGKIFLHHNQLNVRLQQTTTADILAGIHIDTDSETDLAASHTSVSDFNLWKNQAAQEDFTNETEAAHIDLVIDAECQIYDENENENGAEFGDEIKVKDPEELDISNDRNIKSSEHVSTCTCITGCEETYKYAEQLETELAPDKPYRGKQSEGDHGVDNQACFLHPVVEGLIQRQSVDENKYYSKSPLLDAQDYHPLMGNADCEIESAYWDTIKTVGARFPTINSTRTEYILYNNPFDPRLIFNGISPFGVIPNQGDVDLSEINRCRASMADCSPPHPSGHMDINTLLCVGQQASNLLEHHTSRYRLYQEALRSNYERLKTPENDQSHMTINGSHTLECMDNSHEVTLMDAGCSGIMDDKGLHHQLMALLCLQTNMTLESKAISQTLSPILSDHVRMLWLIPQNTSETGTPSNCLAPVSADLAVKRPLPLLWQNSTVNMDPPIQEPLHILPDQLHEDTEGSRPTRQGPKESSTRNDRPSTPTVGNSIDESKQIDVQQEVKAGLEYLHNQHQDLLSAWKKALALRGNTKLRHHSSHHKLKRTVHEEQLCNSTTHSKHDKSQYKKTPSLLEIMSSPSSPTQIPYYQGYSPISSSSTNCRRRLWDDNDILMVVDMDISPLSPQLKRSHSDPDLYNSFSSYTKEKEHTADSNSKSVTLDKVNVTSDISSSAVPEPVNIFPSIHTSDNQSDTTISKNNRTLPSSSETKTQNSNQSPSNLPKPQLGNSENTMKIEQNHTRMALNLNRMQFHPVAAYSTAQQHNHQPSPAMSGVIHGHVLHTHVSPVRMDTSTTNKTIAMTYGKPFCQQNSPKINQHVQERPHVAWNSLDKVLNPQIPRPLNHPLPVPHYPPPPIMHTVQYTEVREKQRHHHIDRIEQNQTMPIFHTQNHLIKPSVFHGPTYAQVAHGTKTSPLQCISPASMNIIRHSTRPAGHLPVQTTGTPRYPMPPGQHLQRSLTRPSVAPPIPNTNAAFPNYPPPPLVDLHAHQISISNQNKSWIHTRMAPVIRKDSPPTSAAKLYTVEGGATSHHPAQVHNNHTFSNIVSGFSASPNGSPNKQAHLPTGETITSVAAGSNSQSAAALAASLSSLSWSQFNDYSQNPASYQGMIGRASSERKNTKARENVKSRVPEPQEHSTGNTSDKQMKRLDVSQLIQEILSASQQQLDTLHPIPTVSHQSMKSEPNLR